MGTAVEGCSESSDTRSVSTEPCLQNGGGAHKLSDDRDRQSEPETVCRSTERGQEQPLLTDTEISHNRLNDLKNSLRNEEREKTVSSDTIVLYNGKSEQAGVTRTKRPPPARAISCYDNAPDGGWGWVVTFSAFMVGVILDGISFSFGLFFKHLLLYFNASKSETSWIISVLNGTYLGIGPIASVLVAAFGCRRVAIFGASLAAVSFFVCTWSPTIPVMILSYGLLGGTGLGLLYLPAIVSVGHYFKKKRALATGIAVCGSGIGAFVFAPLSEFLIEKYTWKGAMWIISAIVLNGIPIAALLRPLDDPCNNKNNKNIQQTSKNKDSKQTPQDMADAEALMEQSDQADRCSGKDSDVSSSKCCDVSNMFDFELLRSPTFLVYGFSCFLCMLGFYIPFTYIPDLTSDLGMSSQQGALLISIIGVLNTVARVLVGWVADRSWADALLINSVALIIGGVATMFVPMYKLFSMMAIYSVVFGASIAVFVSLRSIIMAELLGIEKLTSSFGLVTMCQGLSAFIGAPIAGALSDMTGDYKGAFYLAGLTLAFSGIICIPLRRISRWENRHVTITHVVDGAVFTSDMELSVKPEGV